MVIKPALSKGLNYVQDIMKFIGISAFYELLVDGTGETEEERQEAIKLLQRKYHSLLKNCCKTKGANAPLFHYSHTSSISF